MSLQNFIVQAYQRAVIFAVSFNSVSQRNGVVSSGLTNPGADTIPSQSNIVMDTSPYQKERMLSMKFNNKPRYKTRIQSAGVMI